MTKLNLKSFWLVLVMLCTSHVVWATSVEEFFTASLGVTIQVTNDTSYPWTVNENGELVSTMKVDNGNSIIQYTNQSSNYLYVSFDWKVSSEGGYDFVGWSTNGNNYQEISGVTSYSNVSMFLSAGQSLTFRYRKDGSTANGSDCGFVKNLTFGIATPQQIAGSNHVGIFTDENGSQWGYLINATGTAATVTSYSGKDSALIVPSIEYNGFTYPVEEIGSDVFNGNKNLTSVTLPASLNRIGNSAFSGCENLVSVNIPDDVEEINSSAFKDCVSLSAVTISDESHLKRIGNEAFSGCYMLVSFYLPKDVSYIGNQAFLKCSSLQSVVFSTESNINSIGSSVFENCRSLNSIKFPNSIQTIGNSVFKDCSGLKSVDLGDNIEAIGSRGFYECINVKSIYLGKKLETIPSETFYGCESLEELSIPGTVTFIDNYSFSLCYSLKKLILEEGDECLCFGKYCYYTKYSTNGYNGHYVNNYTDNLFYTSPLEYIYIGRDFIDYGAKNEAYYTPFSHQHNIKEVIISDRVTSFPYYSFYGCNISEVDYRGTLAQWCNMKFGNRTANPAYSCDVFSVNGNIVDSDLVIPDEVKEIGAYTFYGKSISSVTLPNSLVSIGAESFYGCSRLTEITIPSSVRNIEIDAFNNSLLGRVNLEGEVPALLAGTNCFASDAFFYVSDDKLETYKSAVIWKEMEDRIFSVSNIMTEVHSYAADGQIKLAEAVGIGNEQKIIGLKVHGTLNGYDIMVIRNKMTNLRYLDLGDARIVADEGYEYYQHCRLEDNVLGPNCFSGLGNLRTIVLPKDIIAIGNNAIAECSNLYSVTGMPESCKSIGTYAFVSDYGLKTVTIGLGVESIENGAFSSCSSIQTLNIPSSVKTIAEYAFSSCSNLKNVTFEDGLEYLGSSAFSGCNHLENVVLPNTLTEIGSNAFYGCNRIRSISFPSSLSRIGSSAFANCSSITELNLPNSLTNIGSSAFSNCKGIVELRLSNSLTEIASYAFANCSSIVDLKLPNSLITIGDYAFRGCKELSSIHIPSMVSSIGNYAFTECGAKDVYVYTLTPININMNTFNFNGVLHAPQEPYSVFFDYYTNIQWSQFANVVPFDAKYSVWYAGEEQDIILGDGETIPNEEYEQAKGVMHPGSGLEYKNGSYQWLDKLNLKWKEGKAPSLIDNPDVNIEELTFLLDVQANKWYFFCFPFDIELDKAKFNGKYVWRYYDGNERALNGGGGWKNVSDATLKAYQGYIFQTNKSGEIELTISNPIFTAMDKNVVISSHPSNNAQDASWNLVGNPNISYYDLNCFLESFNRPITVWNPNSNTYEAVVPGDDDYEFHPFEAFFVQKPTDMGAIKFENDNRETYNQSQKTMSARRRARAAKGIDINRRLVNISISDGSQTDKTRVVFNDEKSFEYEQECDASKFFSTENVPQIFTIDSKNVKYAINERPNGDNAVRLGYTANAEGVFTIDAQRMDLSMALKDMETGTVHNFADGGYEFMSKAGTFDNRFVLVPAQEATGVTAQTIGKIAVKAIDGGISFNGLNGESAVIYAASGALVAKVTEDGNMNVATGTYVVTVCGKSVKIVVK